MEFQESEYHIVAKEVGKGRKITIPLRLAVEGDTVFIITKRKDD